MSLARFFSDYFVWSASKSSNILTPSEFVPIYNFKWCSTVSNWDQKAAFQIVLKVTLTAK